MSDSTQAPSRIFDGLIERWQDMGWDAAVASLAAALRDREDANLVLVQRLAAVERERDTMFETLTICQDAGTKLVEENRVLKARLARYGA